SWGNLTERGFASLEGCKIVAGGRRPPERNSIDRQHAEGVQDVTVSRKKALAPLQGANQSIRARRSSLRSDLRLLSDNPPGCKYVCPISVEKQCDSAWWSHACHCPFPRGRGANSACRISRSH